MRRILALAMVAGLWVTVAVPASAGTSVERPYKGTEVGTSTVFFDDTCVFASDSVTCVVTTVSNATITHAGKSAVTSEGEITIFFFEGCTLLDGETPGSVFRASGTSEIVAANGDRIFGTYENQGCVGSPGTETIGTALIGSQTITGGTGRFEAATGSTTVDAVSFGDAFELFIEGTITY